METMCKKDLEFFSFMRNLIRFLAIENLKKKNCTNNFVFCHDRYIGMHNYHCPHTTQNNIKFLKIN